MARLKTSGFETGAFPASSLGGNEPVQQNGATVGSSVVRSGAFAAVCASGAGNTNPNVIYFETDSGTVSATNFCRTYFCFQALPGSTIKIMQWASAISIRLTSGGKLQLFNDIAGGGTQIGSDSAATIVADSTTWYRIECSVTMNATQVTACEGRLDGTSIASTSGLTLAASPSWNMGWIDPPGANKTCYLDDIGINNSSGGSQNSWPGDAKVVLLVPTATSASGTGWVLGANTAEGGNGWNSVNNEPPVGVADLAVGSDPKQIRNATAAANSNFDATMQSYTTGGIGASDTLNVVIPIIATSAPVTTSSKQGTVGVVSNPVIANIALGALGTAGAFWGGTTAGTYNVGWKWSAGTPTYAPSVTLGTAPVMRVTQVTSSTRIAMVCFMGMYVDYTPAPAEVIPYLVAARR